MKKSLFATWKYAAMTRACPVRDWKKLKSEAWRYKYNESE